MNESRMDEIVLAACPRDGKGATATQISASLKNLLRDIGSPAEIRAWVDASLGRMVVDHRVQQDGRRIRTSVSGARAVHTLFGGDPFAAKSRFRLLARAISPEHLSSPHVQRIGKVDELRAEILRQRFALPIDPFPSLSQAKDALGWALLIQGASAGLVDQFRSQGSFLKGGPLILATLSFTASGLTDLVPARRSGNDHLAQALRLLAAQAVGIVTEDGGALKRAVIGRWIRAVPVVEPIGDAPSAPPAPRATAESAGTNGASPPATASRTPFPDRALTAARNSPTGRFGDYLVFISHAYRQLRQQDPHEEMSLAAFKEHLLTAHRERKVFLAGADLPQTLDRKDLEESDLPFRSSRFCFIRIDQPTG